MVRSGAGIRAWYLMRSQTPSCEKAMTSSRTAGMAVQTTSRRWLPWVYSAFSPGR